MRNCHRISIGLEAIPVECFVIRAVDHWEETVSPLGVRLCWSRTMAGDEIDWTSDTIHCVAREVGQWRVVCLFSMPHEMKCGGCSVEPRTGCNLFN